MKKNKPKDPFICLCNSIRKSTIDKAIRDGVKNADELYDVTGAGVGPCGGTCRSKTIPMIEEHLKKTKDS